MVRFVRRMGNSSLIGVSGGHLRELLGRGLPLCVSVDIHRASTWPSNSNDRLHIVWQAGYGSETKYIRYAECSNLDEYDDPASWSGAHAPWVTSGIRYKISDVVTYNDKYYDCTTEHDANPAIVPGSHSYWHETNKTFTTRSLKQISTSQRDRCACIVTTTAVHVSYYIKISTQHRVQTNRTFGNWDTRAVAQYNESSGDC
jgi:hypothetical protein